MYREESGAIRVCLRRTGSGIYLREGTCPEAASGAEMPPVLSGVVVAYCDQSRENSEQIVVRDVATDRVLHQFSLRVATPRSTLLEFADARRLFVTADGAVAWLQEDSFARNGGGTAPPPGYDVYAVGSTGVRVLASNLAVEPQEMKLVGSVLRWRVGDAPESAVLE
jgi:hypothetical protein